jgi:hypothetical protein
MQVRKTASGKSRELAFNTACFHGVFMRKTEPSKRLHADIIKNISLGVKHKKKLTY